MRVITALFGTVGLALASVPAHSSGDSRAKVIDDMHAYYLKQFDNLRMLKEGQFGVNRVESSEIKAHLRSEGVPHYNNEEWQNSAMIFGNHGKRLNPKTVEIRYARSVSAVKDHLKPDHTGYDGIREAQTKLVKTAIEAWNTGDVTVKSEMHGNTYLEVRPVKLSKKVCLSCHEGMKIGTPVAAIVYRLTPLLKR